MIRRSTIRRIRGGAGYAMLALAAASLLACATGVETVSARNRGNMFRLEPGQSRSQVMEIMGTDSAQVASGFFSTGVIPNPYCSETHSVGGHEWEILYYATNIQNTDGVLSDSELTPVVLKDGALDGWGWNYFRSLAQEYDIQRTGPMPPAEPRDEGQR